MQDYRTLGTALTVIAEAFERIDRGDTSHVLSLDILIDQPEVLSLAKFVFVDGRGRSVGYEVLWSADCTTDAHMRAVRLMSPACILRLQPWGLEGGSQRHRAWYGAMRATSAS
ncbi:hypothetical protein QTQ03_20565 [Micromonospora sp. WMMA1363]|uniref:hypothetical protein n=1 Tax=Micromonospora sp. WMMA1363 TaxID=3053985 RepID=UPI00259C7DF1|nr:hypothetical protein [Micromonospora sp. WMMA1363]MDM4721872.1 hypothetical protein [Micromonospora sp. WMMA1363]